MKKVLLAWELGDGLGHVSRMLPIARALRAEGVTCAFAVRNLIVTHPVIAREGFGVFQAPLVAPYAGPEMKGKPIASLGDVLATVGYIEPDKLTALVDGWAAIIESFDADLVITDYAPTAALALYGERPFIAIGDWFTLPPGNWPEFRTFKNAPHRVPPERLLETVREVQRRRGKRAPEGVPALMHGVRNFVLTLSAMDPYGAHRERTEASPLQPLPAPLTAAPVQDFFVYLSSEYPGTGKVLEMLATSGLAGEVYLRDASEAVRAEWRGRGLTVHAHPQPMQEIVGRSRIVIHHGGLGTLEQVLAMGRPQCIVPRHFEQRKNGEFAGNIRVATVLREGDRFRPEHVGQAVNALLERPEFAGRAQQVAAELARRGPFNLLDRIAGAALSILKAG